MCNIAFWSYWLRKNEHACPSAVFYLWGMSKVNTYSDNPCAEVEMKWNEEGFRFICTAMIMQFLIICRVCHDGVICNSGEMWEGATSLPSYKLQTIPFAFSRPSTIPELSVTYLCFLFFQWVTGPVSFILSTSTGISDAKVDGWNRFQTHHIYNSYVLCTHACCSCCCSLYWALFAPLKVVSWL